MIRNLLAHRYLIAQMTQREVLQRYRGSMLGIVWSFILPLVMLAVYMFVFSVVFKTRWGLEQESELQFGVILFSGLIVHALFTECLTRAPGLITGNVQLVKKVVFPLEILPLITLCSALFHFVVSLIVLVVFMLIAGFNIPPTAILVPIVLAPLVLLTLGMNWFLASLGVYLRDISQMVGVVATILLFMSPIFFPISRIPEKWQIFIYMNPLTTIVIELRKVLMWGELPDWQSLGLYSVLGLLSLVFGYWWFGRTRRGFADVI
ncbi:MAG: ABC transporter permease [Arenicellaceae bacterium]|nr:ABC transporter permease [Arenicellaceae bacterium]